MAKSTPRDLKQLGSRSELPASPDEALLEKVANPHPRETYLVRFTCPEFTALCPITGQPDFAHLVIDYVPRQWLVESKSLKLYLGAFRNHGAFHEDCTLAVARRVVETIEPLWLRIGGFLYPRRRVPPPRVLPSPPAPRGVWRPAPGRAPHPRPGGSGGP